MPTRLTAVEEIADARRDVQKILASQEFAPSRQLRDFLLYVSEAAFEGRTHLDQIEIAEKVLKRGKDFSPLDDASVRKLGTALRQRLQRYYETEGQNDPIRVTLPVRSYIPLFELRNAIPTVEAEPAPAAVSLERPPSRRLMLAGGAAAALVTAAGFGWWYRRGSPDVHPQFIIRTRQGDIMHEVNNVADDGILLGPTMGPSEELTARLVFTPERATQQAGILLFGDADRYVKLGRQFLARPQLEFGLEIHGRYTKPPGTFAYDPEGQTGDPVWLTIRPEGAEYRAFVSGDGAHWREFGNVLTMPEPMRDARAAIFAHNGRSNAPSAEARFDRVGVGLSFHHRPDGPADLAQFAGWRVIAPSGSEPNARFDGECLVMETSTGMDFVKAAPPGDWTVDTRLDFLSLNGSTAGLTAIGSKSRLRLIRWDLDGGSITAEHLGSRQFNMRDAEGAPPVTLQMSCRSGVIRCSFSRDDRRFENLPLEVRLSELTSKGYSIGLHVSASSWRPGTPRLPARFYYFRQELHSLERRGSPVPARS